jgi:hypothetical protein
MFGTDANCEYAWNSVSVWTHDQLGDIDTPPRSKPVFLMFVPVAEAGPSQFRSRKPLCCLLFGLPEVALTLAPFTVS